MSISKKSPPYIGKADIDRAFEDIYNDINQLIDSVNSSLITIGDLTSGKTGDIRIIKKSEDVYRLEARSEEGWVRPGGTDESITPLTDSTTGTVSDVVNDTTANQKDDVAALAGKINEIITQLNNITFRLVKKGE